jgi:hypothetical protein
MAILIATPKDIARAKALILKLLVKHGTGLSYPFISNWLGVEKKVSNSACRNAIFDLEKECKIVRLGEKRGTKWFLTEDPG